MKRVLCIFRATCYSPGMVERDEAILLAVATRIESMNYAVSLIREEDFTPKTPMPDIVFHMARSPRVLNILQRWQEAGCRIINSVERVRGVERVALAECCAAHHIPTPQTWVVMTSEPTTANIAFPCWVKRTGTCAQEHDDVIRVDDADTYKHCLARFHGRGIDRVIVMKHMEGRCIKFYAVQGTEFFHCLPAYDKWSGVTLPSLVTKEDGDIIKRSIIRQIERIEQLPVIYGGDAIISDGIAYLIDLNDWPSFSACREEAVEAICRLLN